MDITSQVNGEETQIAKTLNQLLSLFRKSRIEVTITYLFIP